MATTRGGSNKVSYYRYSPFLLNTDTLARSFRSKTIKTIEEPTILNTPTVPILINDKTDEVKKKRWCFLRWCI